MATISSYYLSSSDKPGDIITQVQLKGDNCGEWSLKVRGALRARKKTGFNDGSIKKPKEDSDDIDDWHIVNAMVVYLTITYVEESKVLWDDIEQRISVGNGRKLHRVKGSIAACKQRENKPISDYYGRLKRLWDELDKYDRNPTCDCGGWKCNINKQLDKKRDEEEIVGPIQLSSINSAPRMEGASDKEGDLRPKCDNCNRLGHVRAKCFDIIGYLKNWKDRSKLASGSGGRGGGYSQLQTGAGARGYGYGGANSARMVMKQQKERSTFVNHTNAIQHSSTTRMTGKTNNTLFWLLDSGVTHHMTGCYELLHNVQEIEPCMVTLPKGKLSKATKEGSVELGAKLLLKNVLFGPDFRCNLVSVYKLSIDLDCTIQFTNDSCVIQDRVSSRRLVRVNNEGDYFFSKG
ncbi:hypothetical protein RND81_10G034300 [Saponaria officinalis]|uniref:Retrotransposon gag domain-containing protein n=1 Tax=Saponaria officinalis TaxID=3572 RepID=A0AAW1I041_SAPOF